jgi:hypothetical protein
MNSKKELKTFECNHCDLPCHLTIAYNWEDIFIGIVPPTKCCLHDNLSAEWKEG